MYSETKLIGNVGRPPTSKTLPSGVVKTTFDLATKDNYKNKEGEWTTATDWHRCEFFGGTAEYIRDNITSGSLVMVIGKNKTERWVDNDNIERYFTKVRGDEFKPIIIKQLDDNGSQEDSSEQKAPNRLRDSDIQTSSPVANQSERPQNNREIPDGTFEDSLPDTFMSLPPKRN